MADALAKTPHDDAGGLRAEALALLERIEAFGFNEPDDPLGFESRLADEQRWTLGYALAVVDEYRRFLVLTQVAGHAVGPSADVDAAWHLHLTRTVHYERFCREVFGRFLHHEPSRGGASEDKRHRDMVAATLAAYRAAFGVSAPRPAWPGPRSSAPARVAAPAPSWAVPGSLQRGDRLALAIIVGTAALGWLLRETRVLSPLQEIGPGAFLLFALVAPLVLLQLGWRGDKVAASGAERDALEPYEAAWLAGGAHRMAVTAVATLVDRGVLQHVPGKQVPATLRLPLAVDRGMAFVAQHPAELACMSAATDEGLSFDAACLALEPLAARVGQRLVAAGVASDTTRLATGRVGVLAALAGVLTLDFERIFHAIGTPHPIGFLVALTVFAVGAVGVMAQRPARSGVRAEQVLKRLRLVHGRHRTTPPVGVALALGVALTGTAAFALDERFTGLDDRLGLFGRGHPAGKGDGGSAGGSCGSSCSSGGASSCSSGGGSSCGSFCGGGGCGGGGGD